MEPWVRPAEARLGQRRLELVRERVLRPLVLRWGPERRALR